MDESTARRRVSSDGFEQATLFIGIGAARTGTRWLSNYLASHPDVLMSPLRVLRYFDEPYLRSDVRSFLERQQARLPQLRARRSPSEAARVVVRAIEDRLRMSDDSTTYLDYFRSYWNGQRAFADISPSYALLPAAAFAKMYATHPRVRILFSMRDPVDRFCSILRMLHQTDPIRDSVEEVEKRLSDPETRWDEYLHTLGNLEASAPPEAIKVVFFETFISRQEAIDDLCGFIGIDCHPAEIHNPLNETAPLDFPNSLLRQVYAKFATVYEAMAQRFPDRLPKRWLETAARLSR